MATTTPSLKVGAPQNADTTLAIVLGASQWPKASALSNPPSFKSSASAFMKYLRSQEGFQLPFENLLDLFDTEDEPSRVIERISGFIKKRVTDLKERGLAPSGLIFYYIGHGSFGPKDYLLALRNTNSDSDLETSTSLRMADLAEAIRSGLPSIRRYLILDCCFAAAAYQEFQAAPLSAAVQRTADAFPTRGTALLCASGAKDPAKAPMGEEYTMFSGALLNVLQNGSKEAPQLLSLFEVGQLATQLVREKYNDEAVRPEVHTPEQREGDIALIPLFPNPALRMDFGTRLRALEAQIATLEQGQRELTSAQKDVLRQLREAESRRPKAGGAESVAGVEPQFHDYIPQVVLIALHRWNQARRWGLLYVVLSVITTLGVLTWVFFRFSIFELFENFFATSFPADELGFGLQLYSVALIGYLILAFGARLKPSEPEKYSLRFASPLERLTSRIPMSIDPALPVLHQPTPDAKWGEDHEVISARSQYIVEIFTVPIESTRFYLGNVLLTFQWIALFGPLAYTWLFRP